MAFKDFFKRKSEQPKVEESSSLFYISEADRVDMTKAKLVEGDSGFKGQVEQKKVKFPKELGEEHPFDFKDCGIINKEFGFVNAVVDKYVDLVVGPGFYIECVNEKAKTIIEQFMTDVNFDTILRSWTKSGLAKGNGFLELGGSQSESVMGIKPLNANWMYVDRDNKANILGYNQYTGGFDHFAKEKVIPFEPYQIAHLMINKCDEDDAYGTGIIYPSKKLIRNLLENLKDQHMLMSRKANSPYDISIGKVIEGKYHKPSDASIKNLGKDLEWLHNKHEWVHDAMIEIKALDFGNMGDKFKSALESDLEMLFYSFQLPPALIGKANVPEGLAGEQKEMLNRRVQSIQAEIEKIIEGQIFKRVLNANGLDVHVEFQWGRPSAQEKAERMLRITELMKVPAISQSFFKLMEADLVKMLDYDENEYETMTAEEEKRRELIRKQPLVPGQNQTPPQLPPKQQPPVASKEMLNEFIRKVGSEWCVFSHQTGKNFGCYPSEDRAKKRLAQIHAFSSYDGEIKEDIENINDINEWLGFKYQDYIKQIISFVKTDEFINLKAVNDIEEKAGYFSETQIDTLKDVLNNGFTKGQSIRDIALNIDNKVNPGDLYEITTENELGNLIRKGDSRSIMIARTEITRVSNEGAVQQYRDNGVEQIRWVASAGNRTCDICNELNGQIFEINNHPEFPAHINCRCFTLPVREII